MNTNKKGTGSTPAPIHQHHNNTSLDICLFICAVSVALIMIAGYFDNAILGIFAMGAASASVMPILAENLKEED